MEEKTEMERGMGQIPPDRIPEVLKTAHKYRIDENDPAWILVRLVVESLGGIEKITSEGAAALRESSVEVAAATAAEVKKSRDLAVLKITEMQEETRKNITSALGRTLEAEIRNAVSKLQSQSNSPLHRNWLIAMGVAIVVALGLGGYGVWDFYKYAEKVGEAKMSAVLDASGDFSHFMKCDEPGWKKQWTNSTEGKKVLGCYPYPDSKGNMSGWTITP